MKCEYCHGSCAEGATKCAACGAPLSEGEPPDFRFCPFCKRRLLALGSPACNYCGRALPADFQKAREAMWRRVSDAGAGRMSREELNELERSGDDALRRALRAFFDLDERSRRD
ncbi:MAG TPA: hypothetical protein VGX48_17305 [Pyrinomonadaceae bacterium]|nr:hypothetical protein [Pyrinomonadaceae bacterium]